MVNDVEEGFAQIDEDGNVKVAVGIQMAEADVVVLEQIAQEVMSRNSKSSDKVGLEDNKFMGVGSRELLTCCGAPFGGLQVREDAFNHHPVEIFLSAGQCDSLQIAAGLCLRAAALLHLAMAQIWMGEEDAIWFFLWRSALMVERLREVEDGARGRRSDGGTWGLVLREVVFIMAGPAPLHSRVFGNHATRKTPNSPRVVNAPLNRLLGFSPKRAFFSQRAFLLWSDNFSGAAHDLSSQRSSAKPISLLQSRKEIWFFFFF